MTVAVVLAGAQAPLVASGQDQTEVAAPEGTSWVLVTYRDFNGWTQRVLPDSQVTATFAAGQLSGNAGCNSYQSSYRVADGSIAFGGVATTLRACESVALMEQERAYLAALHTVDTFVVDAVALTLHDGDGAVLLTYVPQARLALEGTQWTALDYNNGRGAVVSVLAGTRITARFENGVLTGSGGCNSYTAGYALDGMNLAIGPVAGTRAACAEPPGIMEQEAAYFAALPTASTQRVDGERLILERADGARVASFTAS